MSSSARPLIAVFGATGQQGGAVFRALTKSNEFRVRAITRNPQSDAAQKLLSLSQGQSNVEVVAGDLADEATLPQALSGAWGAFVVTQFWDPKVGAAKEEGLAKTAADAALKAGVKFFLYSSLPDAVSLSNGRHSVHHFTGKNKAEQYIRTLPFPSGVAFPYAGMFASNFLTMQRPKKSQKHGVYEFFNLVRSDVALPIVDLEEEYGPTVLEIFRNPKEYNQRIIYTGTYYTLPQFADAFTKGTGKAARYVQLPPAAGKNFPEEMNDMLQYFNNVGYYGGVDVTRHAVTKKTDAIGFWHRHSAQF